MLYAASEFPRFLFVFIPFDLVLTGLIIFFVIRYSRRRQAETREILQTWANQLGLEMITTSRWQLPRLKGSNSGRQIELFTFTTGSGKSQQTWSTCEITPTRATELTFRLTRQNVFHKVGQWFGQKEITFGDEVFDKHWFVRSNQPDYFQAALLPELREKIMKAADACPNGKFEIHEGRVRYVMSGSLRQPKVRQHLESLIPLLMDLAVLVESAD